MPRIFKHLTRTDRLRIEKCLNEGYTYRQIADVLRVHISTIYREIKKGEYQRLNGATYEFYPAYSPDIAEERYQANLSAKGADLKIGNDHEFAAYIQNKIKYEDRSPAAALADIALEGRTFKTSVCVTTIYSYISKGVFAALTDSDLPDKPKRHRKVKENKKVPARHAEKALKSARKLSTTAKNSGTGKWTPCTAPQKQVCARCWF